ncbi:MAG TPA: hypothetical protein VFL97_07635 [Nitrococcus sp.]|nr:hypothetical protein [Nitrococcus sp.]
MHHGRTVTSNCPLIGRGLTAGVPLAAAAADRVDSGDTAWLLTTTAPVLFMTIPGLSLFYAEMVRSKNALLAMCSALPSPA